MDNTTLISVASVGLICSIVLFLIGLVMSVLCYWRLDIKNIYLIRSGKAKRKTVSQMQEHNNRTGKLREDFDLDYATGTLKKEGRKSGKTAGKTEDELPFKRAEHSGDTGSFSDSRPTDMPAAQQEAVRESEKKAESAETNVLTQTPDTTQLSSYPSDGYAEWINDAYDDPDEGGEVTETLYEARVPMEIISKELIIHTDEVIEL